MIVDLYARETGSREVLAAMLDARSEGERHRGRDDLSRASRAAARLLRAGRPYAWVGSVRYVATERAIR